MTDARWTHETIAPGEAHCHEVMRETFRLETEFQLVEVVETRSFGRGLLIDGRIQHMELDEYIYSESIVHPVGLALGDTLRNILIVGGGPGGAAREALKHKSVNRVVQVEIDPRIAEIGRSHFAHIADGMQEDPRFQLVIADVRDYAPSAGRAYDLIIFDVNEPLPDSPAEFLFGGEMFAQLKTCLSPGGAFVTWAGAAGPGSDDTAAQIHALTAQTYSHAELLLCHTQSYGTSWLFSVGSNQPLDLSEKTPAQVDAALLHRLRGGLRYYDGETHRHMTSLPLDTRSRLAKARARGMEKGTIAK